MIRFEIFPRTRQRALVTGALFALAACATAPPAGPTIIVMPKPGEPFLIFQQHDASCRFYASSMTSPPSGHGGASGTVGGALLGTGVGAAAGALIGSASGHAGGGAAIGAGSGLFLGGLIGHGRDAQPEAGLQGRYDMSYSQCMAANGELLPPQPPIYRPTSVVVYSAYPPPVVLSPP